MLVAKNIRKTYNLGKKNAFCALDDVSFKIDDGELVAIVGKSGAGKSTLLHIMGAIDKCEEGSFKLNDEELEDLSENKLAKLRSDKIGIVMQDFALVEDYSVFDNVELPLIFAGQKYKDRKRKVLAALADTGIDDLVNKSVKHLSGGQKQRVAIARAIVNNPDFILTDEPTGALDTKTSGEIIGLFKKLNENGKTVIIITHDLQVAEQCSRKIEISDGKIVD